MNDNHCADAPTCTILPYCTYIIPSLSSNCSYSCAGVRWDEKQELNIYVF